MFDVNKLLTEINIDEILLETKLLEVAEMLLILLVITFEEDTFEL